VYAVRTKVGAPRLFRPLIRGGGSHPGLPQATTVRQQLQQALSDLELCRAEMAAKEVEASELSSRLTARTAELATATQQLAGLRSAAVEVGGRLAVAALCLAAMRMEGRWGVRCVLTAMFGLGALAGPNVSPALSNIQQPWLHGTRFWPSVVHHRMQPILVLD
jgi:hypothetical protein